MSLLSPYNVSLSDVQLLAQASGTAFAGPAPDGWRIYQTFDSWYTGASATVLTDDKGSYILAFRGTDDPFDVVANPLLTTGDYIYLFDGLLRSLPRGASTMSRARAWAAAPQTTWPTSPRPPMAASSRMRLSWPSRLRRSAPRPGS